MKVLVFSCQRWVLSKIDLLQLRIEYFFKYSNHPCFQEKQWGQVGLVVDCEWAEANSDKNEDQIATATLLDFQLGWYFPIP